MADDEEEERRNFSPDSSTQVMHREKHKHRKKRKHKHKSKKHKRKRSNDEEENSNDEKKSNTSNNSGSVASGDHELVDGPGVGSGDHELVDGHGGDNFVIDIKPLTEYVDDRKELNEELFSILGRKEMKKLLPKSIKKMAMDELKSRCLDQLEVMSKKRLLKIMEGREMSCSTSESELEIISQSDVKETNNPTNVEQCNPPQAMEIQDEPVNILEELSLVPDQHEIDELIEGTNENTETPVETTTQSSATDTESQLLELEYRARALKSMVKAQQKLKAT